MIKKLQELYAPPTFDDQEKTTQIEVIYPVVRSFFLGALLLFLGYLYLAAISPDSSLEFFSLGVKIAAASFMIALASFLLIRRGYYNIVGIILTTALFIGITYSAYSFHGVEDNSATGYFLLVVIASLFFGKVGRAVFVVLSLIALFSMYYVQVTEIKLFNEPNNLFIQWAMFSLILVLTSFAIHRMLHTMQLALDRSRSQRLVRRQAEKALRESEERLRTLSEATFEGIEISSGQIIVDVNQQMATMFGYEIEEMYGMKSIALVHPDDKSIVKERMESRNQDSYEVRGLRKDGRIVFVEVHPRSMTINEEKLRVTAIRDVTERKRIEEALRDSEEKFRVILKNSEPVIFMIDKDGKFILSEGRSLTALGLEPGQAVGMSVYELYKDFPKIIKGIQDALNGNLNRDEIEVGELHFDIFYSPYRDANDNVVGMLGMAIDITEHKKAEEKLKIIATHDSLTDLPNRDLLFDRITHAIDFAKRQDKRLAILFLDLDGFKAINDAYGHDQGDTVLKLVAQRLKGVGRASDTIARLGGDEFAVLLEGISNTKDILPVVEKIIQSISQPFTIQDSETFITSSIGISVFPADGENPDTLLQNADRAMYRVKEKSKNNYQFYSPEMETQMLDRLELRNQLRHAITKNELLLYYEPQINIQTWEIIGVEALLRWQHPTRGILPPGEFLTQAGESGLIIPIGEWVLQTACHQLQEWLDQGLPPTRISVNISEPELRKKDLVNTVKNILETSGIPSNLLELELTENIVFQDIENALPLLNDLKKLGVRIAVDDFGTGYSSLSHLAHFPFDSLKIDQHFAQHITTSDKEAAIVKGIMTIAKQLNLDIIAEGIETEKQLDFYKKLECNNIQGHYFTKALSAEDILPILQNGISKIDLGLKKT